MAFTGFLFLETETQRIDARGLKCPLPVLKLEKRLEALASGDALEVLATDPMARIDIPLYCRQKGHACAVSEDNGVLRFLVLVG
ncbi:MAG: sulfurtransferase TusA family protein [Devosia sp.]|jgi:tRNA 2-thiouridine synthesizing protein A|nr:sulfurtransferase TusA family protein [Devosia sp.]